MKYQTCFKRYELKYLLTHKQKENILNAMKPYMKLDDYGRTTIRNIYFDTDNFRLIRKSIEKPMYKEKLRIRSYKQAGPDDTVFIELKKKYDSVVYKRRIPLKHNELMTSLKKGNHLPIKSQIADEINYFCEFYGDLQPSVFLSYEREAFYDLYGSDFRVTFDENILWRTNNLSLSEAPYGNALLEPNMTLMEIKTSGAIPMWMVKVLNEQKIYKTSFSKYGEAYKEIMTQFDKGEILYA